MEEIVKKWEEILSYLKNEYAITDVSYDSWIKPLELFQIDDNKLYLTYSGDQNTMTLSYVTRKYAMPLKVTIAEITGIQFDEILVISQENANQIKTRIHHRPTQHNTKRKVRRVSLVFAAAPRQIQRKRRTAGQASKQARKPNALARPN